MDVGPGWAGSPSLRPKTPTRGGGGRRGSRGHVLLIRTPDPPLLRVTAVSLLPGPREALTPPPPQAPSLHPAPETRNLRDGVPRKHRRRRGVSKPHSTGWWCTQVPPEAWVGMGTSGVERRIGGHAGPTGTRVSRQSPVPAGKTPVYGPSQAITAEGRVKCTNTRDPHGAGTGREGPSTRQREH